MTADETGQEIVDRVGRLVGAVWGHTQQRMAELGLSGPEAKAMLHLSPGEMMSMRELASAVHVSPSNVTVTVDRLQARGLVSRVEGGDRRVRSVQLTDQGVAMHGRLAQRIADDHPALQGLDGTARKELVELLRRIDATEPR